MEAEVEVKTTRLVARRELTMSLKAPQRVAAAIYQVLRHHTEIMAIHHLILHLKELTVHKAHWKEAITMYKVLRLRLETIIIHQLLHKAVIRTQGARQQTEMTTLLPLQVTTATQQPTTMVLRDRSNYTRHPGLSQQVRKPQTQLSQLLFRNKSPHNQVVY
jgi:hypothetical protein